MRDKVNTFSYALVYKTITYIKEYSNKEDIDSLHELFHNIENIVTLMLYNVT